MKARVWFEAQGRRMRSRGFNWPQAKLAIGLYGLPKWAQEAFARGHLLQRPDPSLDAAVEKAWDRFNRKLAALRATDGVPPSDAERHSPESPMPPTEEQP